jgi:putative transposase
MIKSNQEGLSVSRQCKLLSISRSTCYYKSKGESIENLNLMKKIDEIYLLHPFYGSRQMSSHLRRGGYIASRHKIRRLMKAMGISAIYQKPNTSKKNIAYKIYPYLLKDKIIDISNDVWCADITYMSLSKNRTKEIKMLL